MRICWYEIVSIVDAPISLLSDRFHWMRKKCVIAIRATNKFCALNNLWPQKQKLIRFFCSRCCFDRKQSQILRVCVCAQSKNIAHRRTNEKNRYTDNKIIYDLMWKNTIVYIVNGSKQTKKNNNKKWKRDAKVPTNRIIIKKSKQNRKIDWIKGYIHAHTPTTNYTQRERDREK